MQNSKDVALSSELQAQLAVLGAAWKGRDAMAVVHCFTEDAIVAGEGSATVFRGSVELKLLIDELFKIAASVDFVVDAVDALSGDAALCWATWVCNAELAEEQRFQVRSLFVWRKQADRWRIHADSYSMGGMGA